MQRILIVDDERDVRDSVKCVLDLAGYEVLTADNAADALEQLGRTPTDLVITDIIMPKINGVQAIQSIRRAFPLVRIVAISGAGNFGVAGYQPTAIATNAYLKSAEEAGAHLVLTKTFESEDLLDAGEKVLAVCHG